MIVSYKRLIIALLMLCVAATHSNGQGKPNPRPRYKAAVSLPQTTLPSTGGGLKRQRDEEDVETAPAPKKRRELTKEEVDRIARGVEGAKEPKQRRAFFDDLKDKGILRGNFRAGFEFRDITVMPKRTFGPEDREFQAMRHISEVLFKQAQQIANVKGTNPVEVQLMHVGGKVFVACNNKTNLERIRVLLQQDRKQLVLGKGLREEMIEDHTRRWLSKLQRVDSDPVYVAAKSKQIAKDILDVFNSAPLKVDLETGEVPKDLFTDPQKSLILVDGSNEMHAELKFKELILKYGPPNTVYSICGRKRPCGACFVELSELKIERPGVSFSDDHGKIWMVSFFRAIGPVPEDRKRDYFTTVFGETHLTEGSGGATGEFSDSDAEEDVVRVMEEKERKRKEKKTRERKDRRTKR